MPITVPPYTDRYAWGSAKTHASNRPYTYMRVHGPKGAVDLWALVNSGADYLMFDNAVATRAGITVHGTTKTVTVAGGGKVTFTLVSGIDITVETKRATVDALVGGSGTPLLGRTGILATIDLGIDGTGWLHRV